MYIYIQNIQNICAYNNIPKIFQNKYINVYKNSKSVIHYQSQNKKVLTSHNRYMACHLSGPQIRHIASLVCTSTFCIMLGLLHVRYAHQNPMYILLLLLSKRDIDCVIVTHTAVNQLPRAAFDSWTWLFCKKRRIQSKTKGSQRFNIYFKGSIGGEGVVRFRWEFRCWHRAIRPVRLTSKNLCGPWKGSGPLRIIECCLWGGAEIHHHKTVRMNEIRRQKGAETNFWK